MKIIEKMKKAWESSKETLGNIAIFVIGWIILFDVIAGTFIPIAYGKGCGWFAIPNLLVDSVVIWCFVEYIKMVKEEW